MGKEGLDSIVVRLNGRQVTRAGNIINPGGFITAIRLVVRIRQVLSLELSLIDFFEALTISEQAVVVEKLLLRG